MWLGDDAGDDGDGNRCKAYSAYLNGLHILSINRQEKGISPHVIHTIHVEFGIRLLFLHQLSQQRDLAETSRV